MISGRPVDRIYVRRVLDDVVLPLAAASPSWQSRACTPSRTVPRLNGT